MTGLRWIVLLLNIIGGAVLAGIMVLEHQNIQQITLSGGLSFINWTTALYLILDIRRLV